MSADTGRIARPIAPAARRILFEDAVAQAGRPDRIEELRAISQVDLAHVVMLADRRLIPSTTAVALVETITGLRRDSFTPLRERPTPRGLYLAYESYLIELRGVDVGGALHTGRSRNDLNATTLRLLARPRFARLLRETIRLGVTALKRAERYGRTLMPAYTHYQAAVPITYGHYLVGMAAALARGTVGLLASGTDLDRCPLGAGAVGGTTIPIDQNRTAELLGFTGPAVNSVDAVASRDFVLWLTAAAAIQGTLLSRLAQDLLLWSTAEFGFLQLPDEVVGSSSMMPQKRNPFLLEHVQGGSAAALGAFVAAASAIHSTPYTNSIAVGTEAAGELWRALESATRATMLARLVLAAARPVPEAMARRAVAGHTTATALAEELTAAGMPFRAAHYAVGAAILAAEDGSAAPAVEVDGRSIGLAAPAEVVERCQYGGGPGARSLEAALEAVREEWRVCIQELGRRRARWAQAADRLEREAARLVRN